MKRHIVLTLALTLHCAAWAWQPAPDSMLTEWGAKLTPETAWQEYPRPALARSSWSNLNGLWNLTITMDADTVTSYVGLRETTVAKDADGHLRLFLNGKPLFHFGPLDQGWWPDGLLTPPSDAAMRSDIEFLKAAGFNTLRKHIKVEPRRYYTHCDRLGMMVWQDQVSSGTGKKRGEKGSSPEWTRLKPNPVDAEWLERYKTSIANLAELKKQGIAAGIYTQTTDVEGEINGLITYDRKVRKLEPAALAAIHRANGIPDGAGDSTATAKPDPGSLHIPKVEAAPVKLAMSRAEIEAGLKSHDRALYIKEGWIRDPYITLGPDDFYYLTGTTINENDPREKTDPYNVGLGNNSAVGDTVRVWKSKDLIDWQYLGVIFDLKKDSAHQRPGDRVWAPEVHWVPEMKRWALVHCPKQKSNLALSAGPELKGPWTHPMGSGFTGHHDPAIYKDGDIDIRAKDPGYATPGPDEVQKFVN